MIDEVLLQEYSEKLSKLKQEEHHGNADVKHEEADVLLCELLDKLGYNEITTKFQKLEKWYG